jgi:hypothetical protein
VRGEKDNLKITIFILRLNYECVLKTSALIGEFFAQNLVGQYQKTLWDRKEKKAYQPAEFFHFPGSLRIAAAYSLLLPSS